MKFKDSKQPLISLIVPVFNVEKYLRDCVHSLIIQTYKKIEIILIDDGSTDSCPKICDIFKKVDNRVLIIHQKNAGLSEARNTGIKVATGIF